MKKTTLGRELWALNGKEMKTNLKVDRKQIGSKSYTRNAKGWTTEERKYALVSKVLTPLKQLINQSSVEIIELENDAS